jgi:GNAT superfamily N-acetyltransferase
MTLPNERLARALAFLKGIDERASSRIEHLPFGTAYLRPELPQVWSRNFIWVEASATELDVGELTRSAERIKEQANLDHSRLVFEDEAAAGAAGARLLLEGWLPERLIVMPHAGPSSPLPPDTETHEVDPEALYEPRRAIMRLDPLTAPEDTITQLLAADAVVRQAANERCFAAVVNGRVVSFCRLFSDGTTAQIEDVETLPEYRRRGHSSAVVAHALREAWASHDFVFILADAADWPKDWYARLGFEPAGELYNLVRRPQ